MLAPGRRSPPGSVSAARGMPSPAGPPRAVGWGHAPRGPSGAPHAGAADLAATRPLPGPEATFSRLPVAHSSAGGEHASAVRRLAGGRCVRGFGGRCVAAGRGVARDARHHGRDLPGARGGAAGEPRRPALRGPGGARGHPDGAHEAGGGRREARIPRPRTRRGLRLPLPLARARHRGDPPALRRRPQRRGAFPPPRSHAGLRRLPLAAPEPARRIARAPADGRGARRGAAPRGAREARVRHAPVRAGRGDPRGAARLAGARRERSRPGRDPRRIPRALPARAPRPRAAGPHARALRRPRRRQPPAARARSCVGSCPCARSRRASARRRRSQRRRR